MENMHISILAVSHVWNPKVSATQQLRRHAPQDLEVRKIVSEEPVRILRGFEDSLEESGEFWHDYFSVPQWTDALKNQILPVIHDIFKRSKNTIIYFDDVLPELVDQLYYGSSSQTRLSAITAVCNANWFKRMWTAMEFVRSGPVRMMTANYKLVQGLDDPAFLNRLHDAWNKEVTDSGGDVHTSEHKLGMYSGTLVPWNLGPLREVRSSERLNFAMAFALLSKRRCRDEVDFLHGLRGITRTSQKPLAKDFRSELLSVASACLLQGDYSSLFMTPKLSLCDPRLGREDKLNFNDVWTWELGDEVHQPIYADGISPSPKGTGVLAKFESIGTVDMVIEAEWSGDDPWLPFKSCVEMTITVTGPNLDPFVATLGPRLFGTDKEQTLEDLQDNNLTSSLRDSLKTHHELCWWYPWHVRSLGLKGDDVFYWLADALLISKIEERFGQNRLNLIGARFGTMHGGPHNKMATITCTRCGTISMFRIALFAAKYEVRGARAWRVPGLQYDMSHRDGMAILEKNGQIVGRMMWRHRPASAGVIETIELKMPNLCDPRGSGWQC
ncbi:hypothetical protein COL922a_012032 [Colletotrichum nupharicola]|nr:hypothetical protein COL922a_012032 [Colletotrichum nupharicola]